MLRTESLALYEHFGGLIYIFEHLDSDLRQSENIPYCLG
jgi:hypothetical protein